MTAGADANAIVFHICAVLEDAVGNFNYAPEINLTTITARLEAKNLSQSTVFKETLRNFSIRKIEQLPQMTTNPLSVIYTLRLLTLFALVEKKLTLPSTERSRL